MVWHHEVNKCQNLIIDSQKNFEDDMLHFVDSSVPVDSLTSLGTKTAPGSLIGMSSNIGQKSQCGYDT